MAAVAQKLDDTWVLASAARSLVEGPSAASSPRTGRASLTRERITWRTIGSEVEILIDLVNEESEATEPGTLVIEAAPLGAFVPGRLVAKVPVGAIAAGGFLRVARSVARTALPASDLRRIAMDGGFGPNFPPDGLDLITTTQWAGNLNVWFESAPEQAVEVHRALDLKVAAGRYTAVGVYAPDSRAGFHVDVECMGAGWMAEVVHPPGRGVAVVAVGTPVAGRRAVVNLWVTRVSDNRHVLVELACQSIDGPSDHLGCVRV